MDRLRAIQIIALKEVLSDKQSQDFQLRSIFRWYSKTFHTPLHIVEELPEFDILQAYFEDQYEQLNQSDQGQTHIQKLIEDLSKTEEEVLLEEKRKDEDDVWAFQEQKLNERKNLGKDKATIEANKKKAKEKLNRDRKAAKELESLQNKDSLGARLEPERTNSEELTIPNFEMNFEGLDLGEYANLDANSTLTGLK